MTDKIQAKVAALVAAFFGTITTFSNLPPSQQDAITGPIVAVFPVSWRPEIGLISGAISAVSVFYAILKASHSGPPTLPANPPATPTATESKA